MLLERSSWTALPTRFQRRQPPLHCSYLVHLVLSLEDYTPLVVHSATFLTTMCLEQLLDVQQGFPLADTFLPAFGSFCYQNLKWWINSSSEADVLLAVTEISSTWAMGHLLPRTLSWFYSPPHCPVEIINEKVYLLLAVPWITDSSHDMYVH